MTIHTALGIDEATFAAALRVIRHSWRPGQRCNLVNCIRHGAYIESRGSKPHDIPIPAVTDELLMRMLREVIKQQGIHRAADFMDAFSLPADFEAAIIRATAALDKKG